VLCFAASLNNISQLNIREKVHISITHDSFLRNAFEFKTYQSFPIEATGL
jgi:hypothetical protein